VLVLVVGADTGGPVELPVGGGWLPMGCTAEVVVGAARESFSKPAVTRTGTLVTGTSTADLVCVVAETTLPPIPLTSTANTVQAAKGLSVR